MQNPNRSIKLLFSLAALVAVAFLLSACGGVPLNNYAGVSTDGKLLYMADGSALFPVDPATGTILWKYPQKSDGNIIIFAPPAAGNGWVYAATYKNAVYGFKLEGLDTANPTPAWTFSDVYDKGRIIGAPMIAGDKVLVSSSDHHVYALGATSGKLVWSFAARNSLWAAPAADDTTVYQAGMDHYLYALDLGSGAKKWEVDLGGPAMSEPALSKDGVLYIGTLNSEMLAVDSSNGKILWRKKITGNTWSTPLLNGENLYFGTDQKNAYVFKSADGSEVKKVDMGGAVIASPVLAKDAVIFTTEAGDTISLSLDGANKNWTKNTKGNLYSTPIVIGSQIIVAPYKGDHILAGFDFNGAADEKWNSVVLK